MKRLAWILPALLACSSSGWSVLAPDASELAVDSSASGFDAALGAASDASAIGPLDVVAPDKETGGVGIVPVPGARLTGPGTLTFDRNNTFGWRFTPTTDIDVTSLGFFDATNLSAGVDTGLSQSHEVGIFRVSDQALAVSTTIPTGTVGVLVANFRYVTLPAPVRLTSGTTYVMAGFSLSASPDSAAAASSWTMAPGIVFANDPAPTLLNPTSGTSQYLVSARGNPPSVLTYPGVAQTAILPVFAANFEFTPTVPPLSGP
jgi:hypothetical protein